MPSEQYSTKWVPTEENISVYSGASGSELLDRPGRPEWPCIWFVPIKAAVRPPDIREDLQITRTWNKESASFFDLENRFCYSTNVSGMLTFLDVFSSKQSLKNVLLYSGNKYSSMPSAHSIHRKVSYDNIELILESVNYKQY